MTSHIWDQLSERRLINRGVKELKKIVGRHLISLRACGVCPGRGTSPGRGPQA